MSSRDRRSRTQGVGRLGELRVHFGNEFDGGEGVEEARGGVRGGQGSRGSGKVSGVGGGGGRMG